MSTYTGRRVGQALRAIGLCATLFACSNGDRASRILGPQASESHSERTTPIEVMATWNVITLKTTAAGPFSPPRETRNLAIVSAAVHDAVCSIVRECEPYAVRVEASREASIEAAIGTAAHDALVALYPGAVPSLNASYDSALAQLPAGRDRDLGVAVGQTAAAAVLAMRALDHASDHVVYSPVPGVGNWAPTPPAFLAALEPGWGRVTPFLLESGDEFRPGPPPALASDAYVRDYNEMVTIGAVNSPTRTALQTETARFWVSTAPQLWNQVVRQLTLGRGMKAAKAARAYLLVNLAGADAMIAAWDAKFAYGQWRPVTAIRSLADDGSAATTADPGWTPLLITPPFPDYPAAHVVYAGAAVQVLDALFGDHHGELSITSPTAGGVTHHYQTFAEIADEVENARVWGGVHWRTSVMVGRALGREVGAVAVARVHPHFRARGHCASSSVSDARRRASAESEDCRVPMTEAR